MYKRVHYFGTILFLCSLIYLVRVVFTEIFEDETELVDEWLDHNDLGEYKKLFRECGEYSFILHVNILLKLFVNSLGNVIDEIVRARSSCKHLKLVACLAIFLH